MLEVKNVSKSFGNIKAVQDVSFKAEEGKILSIIGKNGAGKSTIFRMILDILPRDTGEILLDGKKYTILSSKNINATLFIDGLFLENNTETIQKYLNHEIELLSYDNKYDELYFNSALNYMSSLTKKDPKFCYAEYDQKEVLELCSKLKLHTIIPTIRPIEYPYKTIKGKLTNSSVISLKLTDQTINELPLIIDYISQKGYTFKTLEELLSESYEK